MRTKKLFLILLILSLMLAALACDGDDDDDDNDDNDDATPVDDDTADDDTTDDDDDDADDGSDKILAMADTWLDSYPPEQMGWSWDSGLLMLGMWELGEVTGESKYTDYVTAWIDHHIAIGYTIAYNDHVPPARLALRLWQQTSQAQYRQVVDDALVYIFEKADRLPDGGLNHMGWISGNQIWADTLFMVTPFLVEAGNADNDPSCFDEAVLQFEVFADHLRDADTGMYRHMYDADEDIVKPPVKDYWGRGNAWIVAASGFALDDMPSSTAGYMGVAERFAAQVEAMGALIDAGDHRWHTVMNRPETYLETSVGPLLAYGVFLADTDDSMQALAERALTGAINQIVDDGQGDTLLLGTSYGTNPSTWEMYDYVLKGEQVAYGLGATLVAWSAWKENGGEVLPSQYVQDTDETFIAPPDGEDPAEWGWFYIARGDFFKATDSFGQAIAVNPENSHAQFGLGLINGIRFVFGVLNTVDRYMLDEIGLFDMIEQILHDGRDTAMALAPQMEAAENDPDFTRLVERLVINEQGGSAAVGPVEIDRGEAFLLDAVAYLLTGIADVYDGFGLWAKHAPLLLTQPLTAVKQHAKDVGEMIDGLEEMLEGLDRVRWSINTIMAETDDQSDDLIPSNLLELQGEFGIPGVLYPEPVWDLLEEWGLADFFTGEEMPDYLLEWIGYLEKAISGIILVLEIIWGG